MLNRRIFLKNMGLAGLSLSPFMAACQVMAKGGDGSKSQKKGNSMDLSGYQATSGKFRPGLDDKIPANFKTATFALG